LRFGLAGKLGGEPVEHRGEKSVLAFQNGFGTHIGHLYTIIEK
jgi:hypothetical protein